jgi:hypothetical protein
MDDVENKLEGMFEKADDLMINQEKHSEAKKIYEEIL